MISSVPTFWEQMLSARYSGFLWPAGEAMNIFPPLMRAGKTHGLTEHPPIGVEDTLGVQHVLDVAVPAHGTHLV